ncbi:inverse autotransporter adhesin Ilp [Yersinia pestis]|uniref:inverse autotransporter adhesin Ilp n=1 Tax=Yersinia pestis TaxID=632 RepID=UPI00187B307B|nr:inverse autotransporter adhesin Ilp [Yersinia pestis]MBE7872598.1 LysM peptidoglycan-binding domain-containing protein [Yersinia pestis]
MLNYFRAILISWKWKLSHHTSRPHDVKEKGHPRKIKVVAWITLFFQFAFPLSLSFTPAIAAANTTNSAPTSVITPVNASILPPAARATEPYTLGPGDSIQSIAKKYNITVDELKKLNAYRTFSKPFASLTTGDEIEVPRKESSFFSNNPNENNKKDVDDLLARNAMGAGKLLSNDNTSDAASNMARSAVTNEINASSQQWLNQFGTARVQLNVDSDFKLDNSALDLLVPLKDSESSLLFTQLGVRNKDSRNTVNIGAGIRQYQGDWMYGANTFFDNDLTGKNRRVGVGAEVATDYLKFSANTYFGLTGWHQSRDFSSYDERPADGFDIRTEAYLPAYPQLGGKLMYEKYRGDEVALFGKDDRQKDPHAVTLGVNYTPVPLVTIGAEHREGKGNNNNTSVNVQLNYRMGQPWNDQIDQSAVAANRTLAGSRYDLVERNNNIVLDYKKQELIHLVLPDRISGSGGGAITLTAQVRAKYGFSRIEWDATPLENAGGSTSPLTQSSLSVTLPFYQHILRTSNTHTISAVAYDAQGNASNRAVTSIEVTRPETMVISHLATTIDNATANGIATNTVQATVTDGDGQPIIGQLINFAVNTQATLSTTEARTGANGTASTTLTHTVSGVSRVSVTLGSSSRSVDTTFVADESTAEITAANLTVTTNDSVANGSDTNVVRAKVTDAYTNAVANQSVIFSASNGATVIDQTVITNAEGIADSTLTNTTAGVSVVTATLGGQSQQVDTTFKPGSTAAISLVKLADRAVADGIDQNEIQVVLRDGTGNAVPNVPMSIQADNGAIVVASTPNTGVDGTINATFTNLRAGESVVSVTSPALVGMTMTMTFSADPRTAVVSTLAAIDNNAKADGTDTNVVRAWVVDANGNSVPGVSVTFDAGNGAVLAQNPVVTDRNGYAENTLTNLAIGTTTVKATTVTDPVGQTVNTHFVAGAVDTITLTVPVNGAVANGVNTNSVQAVVSDSGGNPVTGATVVFSSTNATAQVTTVIGTTGVDGIATATLTNTVAGTSNVVATIDTVNANIDTAFVAGAVATITLTAPVNGAVADGADTNQVDALVEDANGNPITGAAVVFSSANGATILSSTMNTGVNGVASTFLTHTVAGTSNVVATIGSVTENIDTAFVAGAVATITLTAPVNGAVADGVNTNSVQAVVSDSDGNAVTGATVVFSSANATAQITTVIGTTGADGIATATLTNTVAGTSNVVATIDTVNANIDTTFVAGELENIVVSIINNNALANGADTNIVEAFVTDRFGNGVANQSLIFGTNGASIVGSSTVTTNLDGRVRASATHTVAGSSNTVIAISGAHQGYARVTFVADVSTAQLKLTSFLDNQLANGKAGNIAQALVTDAHDNLLANQSVSFALDNGAVIESQGDASSASGIVLMRFNNTLAGMTTVTATLDSTGQTETLETHFVAGKAASIEMTMTKDNAVANNIDTNEVQVLVTDVDGNAINGAVVNLTSNSGMNITPNSVTTGSDGTATATLTHTLAGSLPINARIDQVSKTINATFIADASTAQIIAGDMFIIVNDQVANGQAVNAVQARVTDSYGNPIKDQTVEFVLSNNGTIQYELDVTSVEGGVMVTFTNTLAGITNVTATVVSSGSSRNIDTTFIADVTTAHIAASDLMVIVDDAVADNLDKNEVHARVTDAKGNVLSGQTVIFTSGNGAAITTVNGISDGDGLTKATLTHTLAGTSVVTARVGNRVQSKDTTFIADRTTATIRASDLTITRNNALADGVATNAARVIVTDANGNPVPSMFVGYTSDNGALLTPTSGMTDSSGTFSTTFTHTTAGISKVTAAIVTMGISQTKDAVFIADRSTAHVSELIVVKNDSLANNSDRNIVQAHIKDAHGNVVTGMNVNFSATENVTLTANTVTTNSQGYAENTLRHNAPVTSAVTATVATDLVGLTEDVRFVAGAGARIELFRLNDGAVADGIQTNRVEARVYDVSDNLVPNSNVVFSADNGGQLVQNDVQTDALGSAYVTVSNINTGVTKVTVTADGVSASTTTTFIADRDTATLVTDRFLITHDNAVANGVVENRVLLHLVDANDNSVSGVEVNFSATNGASINASAITDINGFAIGVLTNTLSGPSDVTVTLVTPGGTESLTVTPQFIADINTANIATGDFVIIDDGAVANSVDANEVRARVTDNQGNAIAGYSVVFSSQNGATITTSGITGVDGWASAKLTHIKAGESGILARLSRPMATVHTLMPYFIADVSTATLQLFNFNPIPIIADGVMQFFVLGRVFDANQNPVGGQQVAFSATNEVTLTESNGSISTPEGSVLLSVTSTQAGVHPITGTLVSNNYTDTFGAAFIANKNTAQLSTLMVVDNNALADGVTRNQVRAHVVDSTGNSVADMAVTFTANRGAQLSKVTVLTDNNGDAVNTLTNSLVGVTVVTAKLGTAGTPLTVDTVFTAGPLATLTLVTTVNNAFADNSATNTVQATLKDVSGNPIVGEVVAFAASNGATITATDGGVSNANGIVLATLTNGTAGVSTVTATIETLTETTDTTFIAMKNLDVTVNGTTFNGDAGFPTTGFVGATFKVNSGGDNSLYDWSSSAPALVSVSGDGVVTFNAVFPTGTPTITISATPKGGGSPLSYSFRVNQWFINNNGATLNRADAITHCENVGYTMPTSTQVTNAATWMSGKRAVGNLWSEWGDFSAYTAPGWVPAEFFWLSNNHDASTALAIGLSTGTLTTMGDFMAITHVMCTRPI